MIRLIKYKQNKNFMYPFIFQKKANRSKVYNKSMHVSNDQV